MGAKENPKPLIYCIKLLKYCRHIFLKRKNKRAKLVRRKIIMGGKLIHIELKYTKR